MPTILKFILAYFISCVCFVLVVDPAADGFQYVPRVIWTIFYLFVSPLYVPVSILDSLFHVVAPSMPGAEIQAAENLRLKLVAFCIPMVLGILLTVLSSVTKKDEKTRGPNGS